MNDEELFNSYYRAHSASFAASYEDDGGEPLDPWDKADMDYMVENDK